MAHGVFVTGTDTEVGKTLIATALLHAFAADGRTVLGMKPVAAGCDEDGRNVDVETLRAASSRQLPVEQVCPYLFRAPIAPHLAAAEQGVRIELDRLLVCHAALAAQADTTVVEGVGGFSVPFNERETSADLAERLALPVVLVVGMRLGCINHALLTQEAIAARGLQLAGWVANRVEPGMSHAEANIETLCKYLDAPLLGTVPYEPHHRPEAVAHLLDIQALR